MKKTWREKLHKLSEARVVPIPARMVKRYGEGRMVIPTGAEVDAAIRKVRSGHVITTKDLGAQLAANHGVEVACPMVTGIFVWLSAEVAAEEEREGQEARNAVLAGAAERWVPDEEAPGRSGGAGAAVEGRRPPDSAGSKTARRIRGLA